MAREFKTTSPPGNWILACVCFGLGVLGLLMSCLALLGAARWDPQAGIDSRQMQLMMLSCAGGPCFGLGMLMCGMACLSQTLVPKTLIIKDSRIELYRATRLIGRIPYANLSSVIVKTRAMTGETALSAGALGIAQGGLLGGAIAASVFNPNQSVGIIVYLKSRKDSDTFWPAGLFGLFTRKCKDMHMGDHWDVKHAELVSAMMKALVNWQVANVRAREQREDSAEGRMTGPGDAPGWNSPY